MNVASFAAKNVLRNKLRTALTVLGVAIAVFIFIGLRTVLSAWTDAAKYAAKDRVATRHKVTFVMPLPKKYVDKVRQNQTVDGKPLGITEATWMNWFGGKHPEREQDFFATIATDPVSFRKVFDEIVIPDDQFQEWTETRNGAVVGDVIAKKFGWKPGMDIKITGTIFPGTWDFKVVGIYTTTRRSWDRSTLWFRWDFLNDEIKKRQEKDGVPPDQIRADQIGWITSRIDDPAKSADISREIDRLFDEESDQTLSMSERQLQMSFMGMFTAVLTAINIVSAVIMLIMMLILGNTIAMGVRERTNEYGVLRAIGFLPKHVVMFIIGEAVTIGLLGGGLGLLMGIGIIGHGIGPFIEENVGSMFPYFRIANETILMAIGLSVLLGIVAAAIPAIRASRLNVTDALRRVD